MGNCFGSPSGVDKEARSKHQDIERQLKADKAELERSVKLLLLGSGESGKSTILKQFKLIHGVPYTDSERMSFRPAILGNLLAGGKTLVDAMERLNIPYETQEAQRGIDAIRAAPNAYGEGEDVPKGVSDAMQALWADPGVQACFKRSAEFQLIDSCQYYMDDAARICARDYKPTDQDILRSRVMTTTITESKFTIQGMIFRIFDVGGQRSERKKWAPYFDDCNAIIFLAAISAYDQTCFEDNTTNRMVESMNLFDSICNHPLFKKTSMILFLNKIDLLKEKLQRSPIKNYFPQYEGPNEFEPACEYFAHRFVALNRTPEKKIYIHFTFATDTNQIKTVFSTVSAIILRGNLEASGI